MTDAELRDAAVEHLKLTTVGFINKRWKVPPPGTQWQIALDYLAKIGAAGPTPPPPPATETGVFCIHYADSVGFAPPSKYDAEYALVVVGWGTDPYLASFTHAKGCAYRTCVEIDGTTSWQHSSGGMTRDEAKNAGLILLDANGVPLAPQGYQPSWAGDIGLAAYQNIWISNVKAYLASMKVSYLFLDNVTGYCWFGVPAKYPTTGQFRAAYLSFLAAQKSQMPGIYRIANAGNPADPSWIGAVAKLCDGVLIEDYNGSSAHNALISAARAEGCDVYGNVASDASPWTKSAAMHKAFKAAGGQFFGVNSGGPDPYSAAWVNV